MKKISFILVALCFLAAAFWLYRSLGGNKEENYSFIASDALFVLETQDPIRLWNRWSSMPYFETLEEFPAIRSAGEQLQALDSLLGGSGEVDALLKGQRFTASLHSVGKERFDFLYLLALADGKAERIIQQLERVLPEGVRLQARTYSGVTLYEVTQTGSDFSLSLAAVDNVLLVSYTSFLIEQAIRVQRGQAVTNFRASYSELFSGRDSADPLAMLRVTADGLYILNRSIVDTAEENMLDLLKNRQVGGSFQVLLREQGLELEGGLRVIGGRAFGASGSGELASRSARYLSNRSSYVFQYDLANAVQLLGFGDPRFERVTTLDAEIEQQLKSKGFFQP
ncbi:hypothetical protein A3SI_11869 [Nitritalea halalkaliphila LW7]|uniref:DUF3352 domain-containing protein n=1 Tax=Nitritalea halalkaliphila LW7 TaxID=1189621 RepID=I5C2K1_9BACT|nr:hypothetical protein [Nitritalea halalkaliphila]EIM76053.1 hypothetical protein A3SI_11869 [Nitritalea halalkaliphila LW7]